MLRHILLSNYRNLRNDKVFTIINLINLIVGFTVFVMFSIFIYYELNWDRMHSKFDRICRVQLLIPSSNDENNCTFTPSSIYYRVLDSVPGVEASALMMGLEGIYLESEKTPRLYDSQGYATDDNLFRVFDYPFLEGDPMTALDDPYCVVLSDSMARKLFPDGNAMNQTVRAEKKYSLKVTGIYRTFPENTHLRPSFLVSVSTLNALAGKDILTDDWWSTDRLTYVLLSPGTRPEEIDCRIGNSFEGIRERERYKVYLRPLSTLYVSPSKQQDMMTGLKVLGTASLLLLILSAINYINLNTANADSRAREIGIRKASGFTRTQLMLLFLSESVILSLLATLAGILLSWLCLPLFNLMIARNMAFDLKELWPILMSLLGFGVLTGGIAGIYPAWVLSGLDPIKTLRVKALSVTPGGALFKKSLVTIQFVISLFILLLTAVFFRQIHFLIHKPLGVDIQNVQFARIQASQPFAVSQLKSLFAQEKDVEAVSVSYTIPFVGNLGALMTWDSAAPEARIEPGNNYVSPGFADVFKMEIMAGRDFYPEPGSDPNNCMINETVLKYTGWKDAIGKHLIFWGKRYRVIGVVRDFHPYSVHNTIPPYVMLSQSDTLQGEWIVSFRHLPGREIESRAAAENILKALLPNDPFEFRSLPLIHRNNSTTRVWTSFGNMSSMFAIASLIISSAGLFGLVLFSVRKRYKSIGIRRVLGCGHYGIARPVLGEAILPLLISPLPAMPLAYYVYLILPGAYKYSFSLADFIAGFILLACISLAAMAYLIVKALCIEPSTVLKEE